MNTFTTAEATITRAVHFGAWLTNGCEIEAILTGGRAAIVTRYANNELGEDIELPNANDARKVAYALLALAAEWDGK